MSCAFGITTGSDEARLIAMAIEYADNMARICLDNHLPEPRRDEQ